MDDAPHSNPTLSPARQILPRASRSSSRRAPRRVPHARREGHRPPRDIRSVLADWRSSATSASPTRAGRVPTDKAFRLFIDAMMKTQRSRGRITNASGRASTTSSRAERLAGQAACSTAHGRRRGGGGAAAERGRSHVRFMRTSPGELLAVLVLSGTVKTGSFTRRLRGRPRPRAQPARRRHRGRALGELRPVRPPPRGQAGARRRPPQAGLRAGRRRPEGPRACGPRHRGAGQLLGSRLRRRRRARRHPR